MAYRKVDDASLTAVADSIREKGGTTGALAFPDGFVSAVQAIQAGGGEADSSFKDVIEGTAVNPTLPSDLTKIRNYAFYGCSELVFVELPSSVSIIGGHSFQNCTKLELTKLPTGVNYINEFAFGSCIKITIKEIPAGMRVIDTNAFYNCGSITQMTFNGKPIRMTSSTFNSCPNLTTINVPWSEGEVANAPWGATNATINYNYTGE